MNITHDAFDLVPHLRKGSNVVVLRGVSGAGKSTLASLFTAVLDVPTAIISADKAFTSPTGEYAFVPSRLGDVHAACLREYVTLLQQTPAARAGGALIVVDNTNTTTAEAAPYMALAPAYGWRATLVTVAADPLDAFLRNTHGVGAAGHRAQQERLAAAQIPEYWAHWTVRPYRPDVYQTAAAAYHEELARLAGDAR